MCIIVLLACALAHGGRLPGIRPVAYSTDCRTSSHPGKGEKPQHRYELSTFTADFATAEAFCVSNGGHLASIHNDDQEAEIEAFGSDAWIGMYDPSDSELAFKWVDSSCVNYEAWAPGEPNEAGSGEDCVHISHGLGGWNDYQCTGLAPFICEYRVSSGSSGTTGASSSGSTGASTSGSSGTTLEGEACFTGVECIHGTCANGICLSACAAAETGDCEPGDFCSHDVQCASTGCSTGTWTCYENDSETEEETTYSACAAHNVGEVGTLVPGITTFHYYVGCYIKTGPATYDAPISIGACNYLTSSGNAAFHQRCHCPLVPIETCRTHCNGDPNCVGYTAWADGGACQTATTSPCSGTSVPVAPELLANKPITFEDSTATGTHHKQ